MIFREETVKVGLVLRKDKGNKIYLNLLEKGVKDLDQPDSTDEESNLEKFLSEVKTALTKLASAIKKGLKKLGLFIEKKRQKSQWKEEILRRLTKRKLKKLCFEKKISTKKTVRKRDGRSGELYKKEVKLKKEELVSRIKSKVTLEDIISFAKRNNVDINDIEKRIREKRREWEKRKREESEKEFIHELEEAIIEFDPPKKYDYEDRYRDTLKSWLESRFPNTDMEVQRGSSRPDIVVKDIAIEIKGPTKSKDLRTLSDKCMRYPQHFSDKIIAVLFDIRANERRYKETKEGFNNKFSEAIMIRKDV